MKEVVTFSSFLKRRHKNSIDTVLAVVDIIFSLGSQCCFVAYTVVREYNKYISFVELGFAAFYFVAMYRRLWLKNFDFRATMTLSTFLDSFCVACAMYQARGPPRQPVHSLLVHSLDFFFFQAHQLRHNIYIVRACAFIRVSVQYRYGSEIGGEGLLKRTTTSDGGFLFTYFVFDFFF